MLRAEVFLDTNIFLYASSSAPADEGKQRCAEKLIQETSFGLSTQVVQKFLAHALRKKALGIAEPQMDAFLALAAQVPVLPVTLELVVAGVALRRRLQLSHWDSTIVAAALELGCQTLYSEDLQHGATYEGLHVVNPFLAI